MFLPADNPTLHLSAGLALLTPPLRDFLIVVLTARHGRDWWRRCVDVQSDIVREKYDTEPKVRTNSDPSFWLKAAEACLPEDGAAAWGPAERVAVSSLRRYRNILSHDSAQLAAADVHQALQIVRVVLQKISPPVLPQVDELMLGLRIQHPTAGLRP